MIDTFDVRIGGGPVAAWADAETAAAVQATLQAMAAAAASASVAAFYDHRFIINAPSGSVASSTTYPSSPLHRFFVA